MKKSRGILILIITAVFIALCSFMAAFGIGPTKTGSAKNINLGLDLAGGVSITYEVIGDTPTKEQMSDTIYKLQQRVQNYSTESEVYKEGDKRITVEIPGVTDANAILEELGQPGSLEFQKPDGTAFLTGSDIANAEPKITQDSMGNKQYVVQITLTDAAAKTFATVTKENVGKQLPIVYDGKVISAPRVKEAISGGTASIDGMESYEEAQQLASSIRIGSLQLQLKELRSNVVGAKLGDEAISTTLKAGAIAMVVVAVFMFWAYALPGLSSTLALVLHLVLQLILLNAFNVTLTLPGLAGVILSIGMSVDANVVIFARIREELTAGKTVRTAIETGFKKAFSAILDGNVTTLIAAAVLWFKGTGTVKGFAQTLAIGVFLSLFTALFVSRHVLQALFAIGFKDIKWYGLHKARKNINFINKWKIYIIISVISIGAGFVGMAIHKESKGSVLNYSLEFAGGTSTTVTFNENLSIADIDSKVKPVIEKVTGDADVQTQKVNDSNQVIIKTRELSLDERKTFNKAMVSNFNVNESLITSESISSTISSEMRTDAVLAVAIAIFFMLLYIWFRFRDIRFAAGAVIALLHDVLAIFSFYAVFRVPISGTFIACMLTIIGFSINATVIIFDRIREHLPNMKKNDSIYEMVNLSITQTLTRSIYTNVTVFLSLAILYVMGVSAIKEFALPLMIGVVFGTYTSVCITAPLWYFFRTKVGKVKKTK